MKLNVGGIDRLTRIVVGLALIALATTGTVGAWACLGVVPLVTGAGALLPALHTDGPEHLRAALNPVQPGVQCGFGVLSPLPSGATRPRLGLQGRLAA